MTEGRNGPAGVAGSNADGSSNTGRHFGKRPNFLILMVDEERYPPVYEDRTVREWRKRNLVTHELLRNNGLEFKRHYTGSTACCPSRATIFTGQYPSLHGVTQTDGLAKGRFDSDMYWMDPNTVPTMGDYFRAGGYRTFYKGKWHISDADILIPGTRNTYLSYEENTGVPLEEKEEEYIGAGRLEPYGFSGWVGPEPHGRSPHNSGSSARFGISGRDVVYASQAVNLIRELDARKSDPQAAEQQPWLIVASFVNPHDIVLFGALSRVAPNFKFEVEDTVPDIPIPPTLYENLSTKPRCQLSYKRTYWEALQPLINTPFYRRLYYQLQKNSDMQMFKVFDTLQHSSFYNDTIVLFFSDHGDLLGSHGGLHQKWYCAYEEVIHVPMIVHNPVLFKGRKTLDFLTGSADILPTMLGLAGIPVNRVQDTLSGSHTEVHPLVGRDLSPYILGGGAQPDPEEPVYFMTDDDPTKGLEQKNFIGWYYNSVLQPNHVETVIAPFYTVNGKEYWKYSRYFDNPQFWTNPGKEDDVMHEFGSQARVWSGIRGAVCNTVQKTQPLPDEVEMYNLTVDPLEVRNQASPVYATPQSRQAGYVLSQLLEEQCRRKRLAPKSGHVPGMPDCSRI